MVGGGWGAEKAEPPTLPWHTPGPSLHHGAMALPLQWLHAPLGTTKNDLFLVPVQKIDDFISREPAGTLVLEYSVSILFNLGKVSYRDSWYFSR